MGTFRYKATDNAAKVIHGTLEAFDEQAVIEQLRESGYYAIRVDPGDGEAGAQSLQGLLGLVKKPTRQDVLMFTKQFQTLLEGGLPVDGSLGILSELAEHRRMREVIRTVLADVQGGRSLADSLAKHPKVFSRYYVNMVKAGETGGVLELVLGRLGDYLERVKAIREEILSAMLYPLLVLLVGAGAVVMLLNFVIPQFAGIFGEADELLPVSTQFLLAVSDFTARYSWFLLGAVVLGVLGFHGYAQSEEGRAMWDRAKLRVPVFGELIREFEIARFTRTLGTLLESGVPVLVALGIVGEMVNNVSLAQALPRIREGVKKGEGISGPLKACGIFPPMAVYMAKVGEETGRLEEMLIRVADFYDQHVKTSVKRLLSLLEPLLILGLGVVVGFIVLSMLLAIFSLGDLPL